MRLFDSHAHIASERFAGDLPGVLGRMRAAGVTACVVVSDPGDDEPDHQRGERLDDGQPRARKEPGEKVRHGP